MDAQGARKPGLRISIRSLIVAIAVLAVLSVAVAWSVQQSRLTQEALQRAVAAERAVMQAHANTAGAPKPLRGLAKVLRDEALKRAAHRDPKDAERVRELSGEIDSLMQIQEDLRGLRRTMPKPASAAAAVNSRPELRPDPDAGSP
jgi:type II secretory pathway pseudopilin PulG